MGRRTRHDIDPLSLSLSHPFPNGQSVVQKPIRHSTLALHADPHRSGDPLPSVSLECPILEMHAVFGRAVVGNGTSPLSAACEWGSKRSFWWVESLDLQYSTVLYILTCRDGSLVGSSDFRP
jgi:hypothetical protein